jgi:hypothetical protein
MDKMTQMGKRNKKHQAKMSQKDKKSQYRKEAAKKGRKYVTDEQNVTNQVKEG